MRNINLVASSPHQVILVLKFPQRCPKSVYLYPHIYQLGKGNTFALGTQKKIIDI